MDVCDCRCDDKIITDKLCSKHESQEEIKRAGDIIKDSEQCDVVPNTQKGVFRLWCRLRKIINTICDVLQRMVCLQKKIKSLCVTLHCMKSNILEANGIITNRNKQLIKRYKRKEPNTPNDKVGIYNEAKTVYEEQLIRLAKAKKRLEEIKNDPTLEQSDGLYLSGNYNESAIGSYDYYSNFSLATTKENVEYIRGSIDMNNNPNVTFHNSDIHDNIVVNLTGVGTTSSGKQIDLRLIIKKVYSRPDGNSYYTTGLSDRYLSITHGGSGIGLNPYKIYRVDGKFEFIDNQGNPLNLMLVGVVIDIDYHQGFSLKFNNSNLVTKVPNNSDVGKYGEYFNNISGNGMSDESSIPGGSMLFAGVGSSVDFSIIAGHDGEYQYGDSVDPSNWFMGFFGNAFKGEVVDLHEPSKPIPPIKECDLMSCDFECLGDN